MMNNRPKTAVLNRSFSALIRPAVILELFKLRLTSMVVLSSVLGYFIGLEHFSWAVLLSLTAGGFLVTGASNTMNQIIEREYDARMERTSGRPLPTNRVGVLETWLLGCISGIAGISILWFLVNPLTGILAGLSLFIYVVLYTPLKKHSHFSVFVGAFPGAIPPMLGWVAATGTFGLEAGLLFAIQFMWQFPHFWAIAWCIDEDYKRAGYYMLPSKDGKNNFSAFVILLYAVMLIPVSVAPYVLGITGLPATLAILISGFGFAYPALQLYFFMEDKYAKRLMFASFLYLPVVLIVFFLDKIW